MINLVHHHHQAFSTVDILQILYPNPRCAFALNPTSHYNLQIRSLTLQLQFCLDHMRDGLVVCGPSFQNLGEIQASGGSTVASVQVLPLKAGLMRLDGCTVVDLSSGREIVQPPLFSVFVEEGETDS